MGPHLHRLALRKPQRGQWEHPDRSRALRHAEPHRPARARDARCPGNRTPLAYRTSRDAGKTWSEPHTILEGKEGALWHDYPAILRLDRNIHLATRHIEIFNTNKWTQVSLHHLTPGPERWAR
jgi:Neuraminidase (sialidase)